MHFKRSQLKLLSDQQLYRANPMCVLLVLSSHIKKKRKGKLQFTFNTITI